MAQKLTLDKIREDFRERGFALLSQEYKDSRSDLEYLCQKGHISITSWDRLKRGLGCAKCAGNKKKSHTEVERIFAKEGYRLLSNYKNTRTPVKYECPVGHRYSVRVYHFIDGVRCPECYQANNKRRLSFEQVKQAFREEGYKLLTSVYKNKDTTLHYECPEGHRHHTKWYTFQKGYRCPACRESRGEKEVSEILTEFGLSFVREHIIENTRLRLDFFVPSLSLGIEYDGLHHFEPVCFGGISMKEARTIFQKQKANDRKKEEICKKKGVGLVRIAYYENVSERITESVLSQRNGERGGSCVADHI